MVKILVPTDYSSCSVAALERAIDLARGSGATLVVLHVLEPDSIVQLGNTAEASDALRENVVLLLGALSSGEHPVAYEDRRIEGVPVSVILATAEEEDVDLIVMGTTGRTGVRRLLMGSVAEEVTRRAMCPVLTLKAKSKKTDNTTTDGFWERLTVQSSPATHGLVVDALTAAEINESPTLALISRAIAVRASDIHIDPTGRDYSVRFRIDGRLANYCQLSNELGKALITQLKVTGHLDIANPFHPQEGRLELPEKLSDYEIRITCVRVLDGEAISLRVLGRMRLIRPMDQLGLSAEAQSSIEKILKHGEGIVLVTGPTGSGKTTTLYSMLHALDDGTKNIVSIEDPVEYDIPTFRQLPVDLKHGMTMTVGLRTLLRLDPDVVLVGEIRDCDTAETAMRAASSGKYVFSSLHTRDVASTVTALRDLRIDNRSIAGNLAGIVSQRLLRRLCPQCSRATTPTEQEMEMFLANGVQPPAEIRHPVGCPSCRQTGYYDRIGVFEVITSDLAVMRAIEDGDSENHLRQLIHSHGICSLKRDALQKVAEGVLSLEECQSMTEIRFEPQSILESVQINTVCFESCQQLTAE